uniref:Bulb-type lectin domain-containing protein n=1 Tax=Kalanchoe fedtschenkoi TaxID=63787 RepID=A0A7N0SY04_KALFE
MSSSNLFFSTFLLLLTISSIAKAVVPVENQFHFTNDLGMVDDYAAEYGSTFIATSISTSPFQLFFYNTTPNAFTLALGMGQTITGSLLRWVWEANRGNPVGRGSNLTLGADGNLVLADADGRLAWQTHTANKGIVGFSLLPTGNMVLYDSNGSYVWQSFDHPTDTLLASQYLKPSSPNSRLVSRASALENKDGLYTLVLENDGIVLHYQSPNSATKKYTYYSYASQFLYLNKSPVKQVTFVAIGETEEHYAAYYLMWRYMTNRNDIGDVVLARPKYNVTLSFLRLGIDGSVKIHTYDDREGSAGWEETYSLFSRGGGESECQLPERCGKRLGLCEDNQCVACPLESGLVGWSASCEAQKVPLEACGKKAFGYYEVVGVDHFMSGYSRGDATSEGGCGGKCSSDCKCLGYFYWREEGKCWLAYDLMTLRRVADSTHVGYIKVPTK